MGSDGLGATVEREWREYVETLLPLGARVAALASDLDDPRLRRELYRMLFMNLSHAYFGLFSADPRHPDFWPIFNTTYNNAPNPDYMYYATPIDSGGAYKISGFRGTCMAVEFAIGAGLLTCHGLETFGPVLVEYGLDSIHRDSETGCFEVTLSPTRPDDHSGDWWELPSDATYILVRQIAYDPLVEVDARIAIDRLDCPATRPRPGATDIDAKLRRLAPWAENWTRHSLEWMAKLNARHSGEVNRVEVHNLNDFGGVGTQSYVEGLFEIEPGEALIYEQDAPIGASYWGVMLTTGFQNGIDLLHRQSHLNGRTARIDDDGKFRAVISADDPGVPNWLDTASYRKGEILGRWKGDHSSLGKPTLTKIRVADVRDHLPSDTPVITPDERDASIRTRRQGIQLRRRW